MSNDQIDEKLELFEPGAFKHRELLDLFEELTFREKWRRVFAGLKMAPETGQYKFAKLQILRLLSPASAVIVPLLMFGIIALFASLTPAPERSYQIEILEPEALQELEEIPPPEIEPPEPPDPIEMDFTPDPTLPPSEVASPPVEYSPQPAEFDSVAITRSPVIMRGIYGSRNPGARGQAMARFGGSGTEGAVLRALRWLKKTQNADGSWAANQVAMTSLALLAYLAHGDTPASEEFGYTIEKAIQYIIGQQRADGRFPGDGHDYTTPIAAYALSEAYAITKVPMIKYAAERAIAVVVKGQNAHGGFNYGLKGPTDERNDLSYIAWCVQALKAAQMAYLQVDGLDEAMVKAVRGVKRNYGGRDGYGGFSYSSPGRSGLTGAGILCLQFLGRPNDAETKSAIAWMNQNAVVTWDAEKIDATHKRDPIYYWYYATQAMFQEGGGTWDSWNKQFSPMLMKSQNVIDKAASGYVCHEGKPQDIGFWEVPPGTTMHGARNNPSFSTILCTLMLEVYYRYLPTFQQPDALREERGLDDGEDIRINIVDIGAPLRRADA